VKGLIGILWLAFAVAAAEAEARDPVEEIQQGASYLEQQVRGVGLGAWGGPLRLDLASNRSLWVERSRFAVGDDPFAGKTGVALTGEIYGSEGGAEAAVRCSPVSRDGAYLVYAYFRGEEGVVFPTVISQTTAPHVIQAVRVLLQRERDNAQRASATLLESVVVLGGARLPLPTAVPAAAAGRLILPAGRALSVEELQIATMLAREGRTVEAIMEGTARTADFLVDGVATELKTVSNLTGKDLSASLARRIVDGAGQAAHIIVDGRSQAGLTADLARRAIARAFGADARLLWVRILGGGFDIVVPRVAG
jgi:contact-dependent growth inhibition (CDI) system CdiA-like toxin